jgi:hypothetical protein
LVFIQTSSLASSSSWTIVVYIFPSKRVGFLLLSYLVHLSPPFSTINTFRKVKKKNISIGLEGMLGGFFFF